MMDRKPIRIFVVEDHFLFRVGLKASIATRSDRFVIVGEAASAAEFREKAPGVDYDILLLDILLPDGNGFDLVSEARVLNPIVKILVLTAETDESTISKFLSSGLEGFAAKSIPLDELFSAIESVAAGTEYFGRDIAGLIHYVRISRKETEDVVFTPRENQIIRLCAEGMTAMQIADTLAINVATVNTHKNNIFKKLGINSSVELVRFAIKNGIITL